MIDDATRKRIGEGLGVLVVKSKGNQIIDDMATLWVAYNALEKKPTLDDVVNKCAGEVCLTVRGHTSFHQPLAEYIAEMEYGEPIPEDLRAQAMARDLIYHLRFYPSSPVGFYDIFGMSVDSVVTQAIEILRQDHPERFL